MNKKEIISVLEKIIPPSQIKNINILGSELVIDLNIDNPSLHAKKKLEKTIISSFDENLKIIVNFNIEKKRTASNNKNKLVGIDNIIAISSGKGGVGKSTITSNLATSLSKMGFKVGILDSDIYGPSIPTMFDVESLRPASVKIDNRSMMEPIENYGVKILSIGFFTEPNQAIIWRGPMASKALNQMIFDTNWGELDFLLVDLPPGTGDIQLTLSQKVPVNGAVIVTTPQDIALLDARRGIEMFRRVEVPVLGVIENMSLHYCSKCGHTEHLFGEGGGDKIAAEYDTKLLGALPLDLDIRQKADSGKPSVISDPDGSVAQMYRDIARRTGARLSMVAERDGSSNLITKTQGIDE